MSQLQKLKDLSPLYVHPGIMKSLIYFDRFMNMTHKWANGLLQYFPW
jgi:hypothetical protein